MNEIDEVINNFEDFTENTFFNNKKYNKEEYAKFKKDEKTQIYELIDKTTNSLVKSKENLIRYLDTQSKFDNYSVGNALLVMAQMPSATILRDGKSWNSIGGYLKRFAKPVKILEPGDNYMREDGSVGVNYNVKKVYDISQVILKQKPINMKYDDKILLKILLNASSSNVKIVDKIPESNRNAMYDLDKDVLYISRGAEIPRIFYEVTSELARQEIRESSNFTEFANLCVSYMLCKRYNIDVSRFNFEIPQELQGMTPKEIREELEPIKDGMENINTRISAYIQKLVKETKKEKVIG